VGRAERFGTPKAKRPANVAPPSTDSAPSTCYGHSGMEEVLVVILGAVVELVVEMLAYVPWDLWLSFLERRRTTPGGPFERPLGGVVLIGTAIGLVLGGISLVIRPQTMLPSAWLRILNVLAAPILSGLLARTTAIRRSAMSQPSSPRHHFWFAFVLTLSLAVVRFAFGARPR
jgi:hypothetical protein